MSMPWRHMGGLSTVPRKHGALHAIYHMQCNDWSAMSVRLMHASSYEYILDHKVKLCYNTPAQGCRTVNINVEVAHDLLALQEFANPVPIVGSSFGHLASQPSLLGPQVRLANSRSRLEATPCWFVCMWTRFLVDLDRAGLQLPLRASSVCEPIGVYADAHASAHRVYKRASSHLLGN
jgi:hypothetical protein